jgi:hypothetical protein
MTMYVQCKQKPHPTPPQSLLLENVQCRRKEDVCRSWVCEVFKSHRVEQGRDVVLRRLRGRSLLLFFRRPCEEVGLAVLAGLVGQG